MPTNPNPRIMCETPVACENCEWTGDIDETTEIRDFWGRVEPGNEMPAGECPKCGTLAYIVKAEPAGYDAMVEALRKIANEPCDHPGFCYHQIARAALKAVPTAKPPRVIAMITGGVLQSLKSEIPLDFELADFDDESDDDEKSRLEALEAEAENLPHDN